MCISCYFWVSEIRCFRRRVSLSSKAFMLQTQNELLTGVLEDLLGVNFTCRKKILWNTNFFSLLHLCKYWGKHITSLLRDLGSKEHIIFLYSLGAIGRQPSFSSPLVEEMFNRINSLFSFRILCCFAEINCLIWNFHTEKRRFLKLVEMKNYVAL